MKNVSLAVLLVAAVFLGALAWWQSQQIAQLEQNAASAMEDRNALQHRLVTTEQRVATAEKSRATAETELTNLRNRPAPAPTPTPRTNSATTLANSMAALDNPAIQKVMAATMKSSLDQRYGGLFRQLKLSPAELEKFKDLLTERQMSSLDVMRVAQQQGINPGTNGADLAKLMGKAQSDVDDSIRSLIGDQRFEQYQGFNQNIASYTLLDQIDRRLSYTNAPLQPSQSDALLHVLIETAQPMPGASGPGGAAMASFAQSMAGTSPIVAAMTTRPLSNDTIARAQTVLTPAQAEVLTLIQTEQQSQTNMLQSLRSNAGAIPGAAPRPGSVGAPVEIPAPGTPTPSR
jgi:hypothetical protein